MGKFDVLFVFVVLATILGGTTIRLCNAKPTARLLSNKFDEERNNILGTNSHGEDARGDNAFGGTSPVVPDAEHNADETDSGEDASDFGLDLDTPDSGQVPNTTAGKEQPTTDSNVEAGTAATGAGSGGTAPAASDTEHEADDADFGEDASDFDFDQDTTNSGQAPNTDVPVSEVPISDSNVQIDIADVSMGEENFSFEAEQEADTANTSSGEHSARSDSASSDSSSSSSSAEASSNSTSSSSSGSSEESANDEATLIEEIMDKNIEELTTSTNGDEMTVQLPNGGSLSTHFLSQDFVRKLDEFKHTVDAEINTLNSQVERIEEAVGQTVTVTNARLTQMKQTFDTKTAELENHVRSLDQALNDNASKLDMYINSLDKILKQYEANTKSENNKTPLVEPTPTEPALVEPQSPASEAVPVDIIDTNIDAQTQPGEILVQSVKPTKPKGRGKRKNRERVVKGSIADL